MRTPPRRFAITDSLTGGSEDSDPRTRQFLVSNLVKVGFSGISGLTREELRAHKIPYTTGGDQSLPGACPADGTQNASNVVGLGSVKFADLQMTRTNDYRFSYKKMLSLSGNTAPYMLYAHARIRGISRKLGDEIDFKDAKITLEHPSEISLAR